RLRLPGQNSWQARVPSPEQLPRKLRVSVGVYSFASSCLLYSRLKHEEDNERDHESVNSNRFREHNTQNHVGLDSVGSIRITTNRTKRAVHQHTNTDTGT